MSALRDAAQQALEWLDEESWPGFDEWVQEGRAIRASLRAALAEQCQCGDRPAAECPGEWEPGCDLGANEAHAKVHEPQEPVAWGMRHSDGRIYDCIAPGEHDREPGRYTVPLYTRPAPQRQPLSDEEIDRVTDAQWAANNNKPVYAAHRAFARAIEAAHGITGEQK